GFFDEVEPVLESGAAAALDGHAQHHGPALGLAYGLDAPGGGARKGEVRGGHRCYINLPLQYKERPRGRPRPRPTEQARWLLTSRRARPTPRIPPSRAVARRPRPRARPARLSPATAIESSTRPP